MTKLQVSPVQQLFGDSSESETVVRLDLDGEAMYSAPAIAPDGTTIWSVPFTRTEQADADIEFALLQSSKTSTPPSLDAVIDAARAAAREVFGQEAENVSASVDTDDALGGGFIRVEVSIRVDRPTFRASLRAFYDLLTSRLPAVTTARVIPSLHRAA